MDEKTIVIVSDLQVPYHDKRAIKNLLGFLWDYRPNALVNIGDDIDAPQPSHWHRGGALEYAGTLQRDLDLAAELHGRFRQAVGDVPYHVSRSNHGDRVSKYVKQYAPALDGLRSLDVRELLGYREQGIEYEPKPFKIAPDWVACHGDEGRLSGTAGSTAAGLSRKWGVSVACGHTHRAGLVPYSTGHSGQSVTRWGLEVGHLMDTRSAGTSYLKGGHADWQKAFGILHQRGTRVHPQVIPIQPDGSFCVEGLWYPTHLGKVSVRAEAREAAA